MYKCLQSTKYQGNTRLKDQKRKWFTQIQIALHLHIRIPLLTVNKMDTHRQN